MEIHAGKVEFSCRLVRSVNADQIRLTDAGTIWNGLLLERTPGPLGCLGRKTCNGLMGSDEPALPRRPAVLFPASW